MKTAYFDCASGASGDMLLGALIDAGADLEEIKRLLEKLPLSNWQLTAQKTVKNHLSATKADVSAPPEEHGRHLAEIEKIIAAACLPEPVEKNSLAVFRRLADAEAKIHGCSVEKIHFHEVGAVDAIIDIVGCCCALYVLNIERLYSSALPCGHGSVRCAHGLLPLPAPADRKSTRLNSVTSLSRMPSSA